MSEWEAAGRLAVVNGELKRLRKELGLNRSSMAELLRTSMVTYAAWEEGDVRLRSTTAERIGRFCSITRRHLDLLHEDGIELADLMPLHHATVALGAPQELLLKRIRDKHIDVEDLGILGLWLYKEDLERIRDVL